MSEQPLQIQNDQILLGPSLTIREADAAYALLNEINPAQPWQLDVSALATVDTAGIQLLILLEKRLHQAGGALEWHQTPTLLNQALADLGLNLQGSAHV